jgi:DNA-directed RNA polymerase specialized sigma24 family protein
VSHKRRNLARNIVLALSIALTDTRSHELDVVLKSATGKAKKILVRQLSGMEDLAANSALVHASVQGDEKAWNELVQRYAWLIAAVIRHYRLTGADAQDVSQLVWLHLIEHLPYLREPAALPGWLVTTTKRECQRYVQKSRRTVSIDPTAARVQRLGVPARAAARVAGLATRVLPVAHRVRYRDEYQSELYEISSAGASWWQQMMYAIRLLDRSWELRFELRQQKTRRARS